MAGDAKRCGAHDGVPPGCRDCSRQTCGRNADLADIAAAQRGDKAAMQHLREFSRKMNASKTIQRFGCRRFESLGTVRATSPDSSPR